MVSRKVRFSIVTVCFNNLAGLKKTVDSILNQDQDDYEFFIVDGASTDGTQEYLACLAKSNVKVKYLSEPDTGIFDAMNKGGRQANGEWIIFMNSGDVFYCDNVLSFVSKSLDINSENYDIIYGHKSLDSGEIIESDMNLSNAYFGEMPACHQAIFFKKNIVAYKSFYKIFGDVELMMSLYKNNAKYLRLDIPICITEPNGISQRISTRKRFEKVHALFIHFGFRALLLNYLLKRYLNVGRGF